MEPRVTGQTKAAGFQIGVRRTFPISAETAWKLVTTGEIARMWLETEEPFAIAPGVKFGAEVGTRGEMRIVKPNQQLRLAWQTAQWSRPSTIQVRFLAGKGEKTTISFHQEHLVDASVREEMREKWERVLAAIGAKVESGHIG